MTNKDMWKAAIGLQKVDNLNVSDYLLELIKQSQNGSIKEEEIEEKIINYYESIKERDEEENTKEADIVSARIKKLLNTSSFNFSIVELLNIHGYLFKDLLKDAGTFRKRDISKKEWVLNNDTVVYSSFHNIESTLKYDFKEEENFSYKSLNIEEIINHITKFTSYIWQIHPFSEGNTRTITVFIIKYLKTLGFNVNYKVFADNSHYFRNALVRANYTNYEKKIFENDEYLKQFFKSLLTSTDFNMKSKDLHVDKEEIVDYSKLNCTLEEKTVLMLIKDKPSIKEKEMSLIMSKSIRTIKNYIFKLKAKNLIERVNGKRNGRWIAKI